MTGRIERAQAGRETPNRLLMYVEGLHAADAEIIANDAVAYARALLPKVTGNTAKDLQPISGMGYFGIAWSFLHTWALERGYNPFTMNSLVGRVIPMWVNDPMGTERKANPRAQTRLTVDGRQQVLIFRRVARHGQRRREMRNGVEVDVPASYPGAPGRISRREAPAPFTSEGKLAGQIAKGNIGVRWRHPGSFGTHSMHEGLRRAARLHGLDGQIRPASLVERG